MVGLSIRFDLGRYHATPWGANVNDAVPEWPPSPWRLLRAIYSASRTDIRLAARREAVDRALGTLVASGPPAYELPAALAGHTRHYMPKVSYSPLHRDATTKILDGFMALDPVSELRAWWEASLDEEAAAALAEAVRSLAYLGRSESLCSATLLDGEEPGSIGALPLELVADPDEGNELVDLLCPATNQSLEMLTVSVTELRSRRHLVPPGAQRVTYAVRHQPACRPPRRTAREPQAPQVAVFRLTGGSRPAITEAVALGQALRSAVQSRYGAANDRAASPTFSGRNGDSPRSDQHLHAHYLAAPEDHGARVDRLFVWAPEGFGPREIAALTGVTYIKLHESAERLPCVLAALGVPEELQIPPVLGRARAWRSLTPFGLLRHPKVRGGQAVDTPEDQVRAELRRRGGLPEPEEIVFDHGSWHRFRSSKVGTSRLQRARLYGVRLRFAKPVQGPIAIGALSHYGLGVMRPDD